MTLVDLFAICFIVGFALTMFSLLVGMFHIDLPGNWDSFLHGTHAIGHGHGVGHGLGHVHADAGHPGDGHVPKLNFSTIMAFLAMFGGTGYLLSRHSTFTGLVTLSIAVIVGFAGAAVIGWFFTKMLIDYDKSMRPEDFEIVGTIGTVTTASQEGQLGELVYEQNGVRHSIALRSEDGVLLRRGDEVVITKFEKGIAYGKKFEEFVSRESEPARKTDA